MSLIKKRHHHTPEAYLKPFCDEGKLWWYRKDAPRHPTHKSPRGVGFRWHYYAQPLPGGEIDHNTLENFFSKFESKWPGIVKRLEQREDVNDCRQDIVDFIALQRVRVPAARDATEVMFAECVKDTLRLLDAAGGLPPKPEGYEDILESVDVAVKPIQSIHAMVSTIQGAYELLAQVGIGVLHNNTTISFLTSDNPVVWFDPSVAEDKMLPYCIQKGGPTVLLFPVTPNLMIYGHSSKREQFAKYGFMHGELSDCDMVEAMNRQICRFAYESVFSQRAGQEALVSKYAELSPVIETRSIPYKNGILTSCQHVWGTRTRKPKD